MTQEHDSSLVILRPFPLQVEQHIHLNNKTHDTCHPGLEESQMIAMSKKIMSSALGAASPHEEAEPSDKSIRIAELQHHPISISIDFKASQKALAKNSFYMDGKQGEAIVRMIQILSHRAVTTIRSTKAD
jgi:hypothetical protein